MLCTECRQTQLGREYTGTLSTTVSGKTCQAWASDTPHDPNSSAKDDSNYPDGSREAASNYCRNPASDSGGLWCYTTDPDTRWEYCDVPLCSGTCIMFIVCNRNE